MDRKGEELEDGRKFGLMKVQPHTTKKEEKYVLNRAVGGEATNAKYQTEGRGPRRRETSGKTWEEEDNLYVRRAGDDWGAEERGRLNQNQHTAWPYSSPHTQAGQLPQPDSHIGNFAVLVRVYVQSAKDSWWPLGPKANPQVRFFVLGRSNILASYHF